MLLLSQNTVDSRHIKTFSSLLTSPLPQPIFIGPHFFPTSLQNTLMSQQYHATNGIHSIMELLYPSMNQSIDKSPLSPFFLHVAESVTKWGQFRPTMLENCNVEPQKYINLFLSWFHSDIKARLIAQKNNIMNSQLNSVIQIARNANQQSLQQQQQQGQSGFLTSFLPNPPQQQPTRLFTAKECIQLLPNATIVQFTPYYEAICNINY